MFPLGHYSLVSQMGDLIREIKKKVVGIFRFSIELQSVVNISQFKIQYSVMYSYRI